jgi:hypothetical protein
MSDLSPLCDHKRTSIAAPRRPKAGTNDYGIGNSNGTSLRMGPKGAWRPAGAITTRRASPTRSNNRGGPLALTAMIAITAGGRPQCWWQLVADAAGITEIGW